MKDGIKKNITYNSVYRIVIMLTPLLTSPYLTRTLGAENLGVFTFHRAISSYFVLFALLGVSDYGTRTIAKNRGDETEISSSFWQIYYLQFMMTTVALCVYLFTIFSSSNKIVSFIFMFQVFSCYFDISWLAFGLEEFRFTSIRSIIVQVCFVVSLFVFVRNDGDLLKYAVITILVDIVSLIVLWTIVFRRLQWQKPDWNLIKKFSYDGIKYGDSIRIPKPKNIDKMFEFANVLSKGIPFVRIDFYEMDGKLYFGELTFYPNAGFETGRTKELDDYLDSKLKI